MKWCLLLLLAPTVAFADPSADIPAHLPGETSADEILNGVYPFPPSPSSPVVYDDAGLDKARLGKTPPPGIHPRLLTSPDELPGVRQRLAETEVGREQIAVLHERLDKALRAPGSWGKELFDLLASGDIAAINAGLLRHKGLPDGFGHYQPYLEPLTLEAERCLIEEDQAGGKKIAAALTTYAQLVGPALDKLEQQPLHDDVWRLQPDPDPKARATWADTLGPRDLVGYNLLGYAYDFSWPFMDEPQRDTVRAVIAKATAGKLWMGARLPHHMRDWNWVAIGLGQPMLALSIEGEKGYDPRVYKLGVQIAADYLAYGISPAGSSTEAVGYTQFGLTWLNGFAAAAARRGEPLLAQDHFRNMLNWYVYSLDPQGGKWSSHGDGGDGGPSAQTLLMWRYYYPQDARADFLWQNLVKAADGKPFASRPHMVETLLWATDPVKRPDGRSADDEGGAKLGLPLTSFDPVRSSLNTRSAWLPDAAAVQFECRTDSFSASHEHADRGNFTFAALGRDWAKENFRSIETRHHNSILIDGMGQGFWPGPGKWLGLQENAWAVVAACDAKDPYDWEWPKQLQTEPPDFIRFKYQRWKDYPANAAQVAKRYAGLTPERDPRPSVAAQWQGFADAGGGPRLWDEDTWPVRYPHNPVQRAFRTIAFARGAHPYLLIVDDIQKDNQERLYEWLMQTGTNTALASMKDGDIVLCDDTVKRNELGELAPKKGDPELLVRILDMGDPKLDRDYQSRPSVRLETFDRKDTLVRQEQGLSGARSFGLDKRLVIASRSVAPDYKILLFPHRHGDPLPTTNWNAGHTQVMVTGDGLADVIAFAPGADGRTRVTITRAGEAIMVK